jgi:hypothetical protein
LEPSEPWSFTLFRGSCQNIFTLGQDSVNFLTQTEQVFTLAPVDTSANPLNHSHLRDLYTISGIGPAFAETQCS